MKDELQRYEQKEMKSYGEKEREREWRESMISLDTRKT